MPNLSCRICGRVVYTSSSLDSLFAEERRCPRCGAMLFVERRMGQRRQGERRTNPPDVPGPPGSFERRTSERRKGQRRRDDHSAF
jgi:hypothetical protein